MADVKPGKMNVSSSTSSGVEKTKRSCVLALFFIELTYSKAPAHIYLIKCLILNAITY